MNGGFTKRKLIALIIAIAVMLIPIEASAQTVYVNERISVHKTANWKAKKITTAKHSAKVDRVKRIGTWSKVKIGKKKGWIKSRYLSKKKPPKVVYKGSQLRYSGVIWWNGCKFTWYTQRILPGYGLQIPGRHLDKQGFVCDKNNYIVLGSNTANRGKIIKTPFGKYGKVYDAGVVGAYWFDCYTDWPI